MDLRVYLEEDMLSFLDARLSVDFLKEQSTKPREENMTSLFGKDYEKLLFAALQDHNVVEAKRVLHEVKDEFNRKAPDSLERKQLKALLHVLYQKFKSYIESENTIKKLERAIDNVDSPDVARKHLEGDFAEQYGKATSKKTLPTTPEVPQTPAPNAPKTTPQLEEPVVQGLSDVMTLLETALQQKDVKTASGYYHRVQQLFAQLPPSEQKKQYDRILQYHSSISALIHETTVKTPTITQTEKDLLSAMDAQDLHEAMLHYEELREQVLALSKEEQAAYVPRLKEYHQWILSAWNRYQANHQKTQPSALDAHERRLSGKP